MPAHFLRSSFPLLEAPREVLAAIGVFANLLSYGVWVLMGTVSRVREYVV